MQNAETKLNRGVAAKIISAFFILHSAFILPGHAADAFFLHPTNNTARVVIVEDSRAINDFAPDPAVVQRMVNRGLTNFTGRATVAAAWRSLVSTQDIVGLKVFSAGGEISGTRPAVVAAVVHGLLDAGLPPDHIIIWDKYADDLRAAGFFKLGKQLGVRVAGAVETGFDPTNFYLPDSPVIGTLRYGDLEFGKKGEGVGRKSFVSLLVSRQITKIISIAPLLNENDIGTCGHLYSVALGSVDNTFRFEGDPDRLAIAVPEIYALAAVGDRVAFNITDALLAQYEGGPKGLLQYSTVLDQLWFSRDPVALDTLALQELARERAERHAAEFKVNTALYTNAALLQLGIADPAYIQVRKLK
jgi:hypothetical protein